MGRPSLFFRARSPNTAASDRKHDAVTVNTVNHEGTGTVTATKPSLAPLTNVVLTYCVQIDQ